MWNGLKINFKGLGTSNDQALYSSHSMFLITFSWLLPKEKYPQNELFIMTITSNRPINEQLLSFRSGTSPILYLHLPEGWSTPCSLCFILYIAMIILTELYNQCRHISRPPTHDQSGSNSTRSHYGTQSQATVPTQPAKKTAPRAGRTTPERGHLARPGSRRCHQWRPGPPEPPRGRQQSPETRREWSTPCLTSEKPKPKSRRRSSDSRGGRRGSRTEASAVPVRSSGRRKPGPLLGTATAAGRKQRQREAQVRHFQNNRCTHQSKISFGLL